MNGLSHGVGQDPLLDLVNTRDYRVGYNDSPASIARRFGLAMSSLIAANPQKPTTVVAGTRTFRDLRIGETLSIPSVGLNGTGVGDVVTDTLSALAQVNPCDQTYVGMVCSAQSLLGLQPDGKWGSGSASKARARFAGSPPACSPRPSWWAPVGQSNCGAVSAASPVPSAIPTPSDASSPVPALAQAALAAINADPNYCASVGQPGSSVNSAVHAFKAAWNADNPSMPVPIGTGRYESATANALSLALGRQPAPPACGAAAPAPMPAPMPLPAPGPDSAPIPGPGGPGGGGGPGGPGGSTSVVVQPGGGGTYPLPAPKKPGISTGAIVAGAIGVAALVGIVAIAATSKGGKTTTRYRTRKGKTRYITRRAPRKSKHNKSRERR